MSKKIERMFRESRLSPEEVARDEDVRRRGQAEFPPASPSGIASGPLSQALRNALRESGKSMGQIAQDAGVSQTVVSRFVFGERDICLTTADKLAEALGLKLVKAS